MPSIPTPDLPLIAMDSTLKLKVCGSDLAAALGEQAGTVDLARRLKLQALTLFNVPLLLCRLRLAMDLLRPWEEHQCLAIRVISVDVAFPAIVLVLPYHSFTSRGSNSEQHRDTMVDWIVAQAIDFDAPVFMAALPSANPAHLEFLRSAQTPGMQRLPFTVVESHRIWQGPPALTLREAKDLLEPILGDVAKRIKRQRPGMPLPAVLGGFKGPAFGLLLACIINFGIDENAWQPIPIVSRGFAAPILVRWAAEKEQEVLERGAAAAEPRMLMDDEERWLSTVVAPFCRRLATTSMASIKRSNKNKPASRQLPLPNADDSGNHYCQLAKEQGFRCAVCGCLLTFFRSSTSRAQAQLGPNRKRKSLTKGIAPHHLPSFAAGTVGQILGEKMRSLRSQNCSPDRMIPGADDGPYAPPNIHMVCIICNYIRYVYGPDVARVMIANIIGTWHREPPPMAPSPQQPGTRFLVAEVTEPPPPPSRREMRTINRLAKAKAQSARATAARRKFPTCQSRNCSQPARHRDTPQAAGRPGSLQERRRYHLADAPHQHRPRQREEVSSVMQKRLAAGQCPLTGQPFPTSQDLRQRQRTSDPARAQLRPRPMRPRRASGIVLRPCRRRLRRRAASCSSQARSLAASPRLGGEGAQS